MSDSLQHMDCSPPGSSVNGILQAKILEKIAVSFFRSSFQPRDQTQVSCIASDPPGKSKNTGVGNLSLLQEIFPTQESNRGLLHCRWILYQLSYQGSLKHSVNGFLCRFFTTSATWEAHSYPWGLLHELRTYLFKVLSHFLGRCCCFCD